MEGKIEVRGEVSARAVAVTPALSAEQFQQLQLGLQEQMRLMLRPPPRELPFFTELVQAWLAAIEKKRAQPRKELWVTALLRPLRAETEETLTVAMARELLEGLAASGYSAKTVNAVRSAAKLTVALAQESGRWGATNPFALVKRSREPRREYELLTLDELELVQRKLRPDRRRAFRLALHLGLRPGELFALQRRDVDLVAGVIHVRRSHDRDSTKTGEPRDIPLLRAVAGDVAELMRAAPCDDSLLLAGAGGGRQRRDAKLSRTLRTAMAAARVAVVSVTYRCRRAGCGRSYVDVEPPVTDYECHECGFKMWPVPRVRAVTWYNLRHMCASFNRAAGADPLATAALLGHRYRGESTGENVYTHFTIDQLHAELGRWWLPDAKPTT